MPTHGSGNAVLLCMDGTAVTSEAGDATLPTLSTMVTCQMPFPMLHITFYLLWMSGKIGRAPPSSGWKFPRLTCFWSISSRNCISRLSLSLPSSCFNHFPSIPILPSSPILFTFMPLPRKHVLRVKSKGTTMCIWWCQ